jgi:hypothetical protein
MTSKKARALLKQASLPSSLWEEAVTTVVFYENITPMKRLKWKSPYELWHGKQFDYSRLHSFGCWAYINIPKEKRIGKFGDTSKKGILVGYWQGIRN